MFGYTAKEVLGQSIAKLLPDGRLDEERAMLGRIAHGDKVAAFETQRRRKDGTMIHVSIRLSPIVERDRVVGASKVVRDITERKQMEEATRRANAYLASAVDSIQDAFALYDERDRVVLVNSAFRQLFGSGSSGAIVGQTFTDVLDASIRAHVFTGDSTGALRERLLAYHRAPSGTVELRTTSGRIPVIALSAAALPRDTARANDAGFRRYLTKPVDIDELTAAFEEILGAATDRES
jgi:PAS domain S-box-containing protein